MPVPKQLNAPFLLPDVHVSLSIQGLTASMHMCRVPPLPVTMEAPVSSLDSSHMNASVSQVGYVTWLLEWLDVAFIPS